MSCVNSYEHHSFLLLTHAFAAPFGELHFFSAFLDRAQFDRRYFVSGK